MQTLVSGLLVAATVFLPAFASGQRLESLPQGAKVRVNLTNGSRTVGYMDTVTFETIGLHVFDRDSNASSLKLNRDLVQSMEVRKRVPGRGVLKGAAYGLVIGAVGGFVLGAATYSESDSDYCFIVCSAGEAGAMVGILGAGLGLPTGMIIGGLTNAEWRAVDIRRAPLP